VTTGAGKAEKAGKSAVLLNWTGKARKLLLFSYREAGKLESQLLKY